MAVLKRLKGILINPVETFRDAKNDKIRNVFKYFLCILSIDFIIWGLLILVGLYYFAGLYNIDLHSIDYEISVTSVTLIIQVVILIFIYVLIGLGIATLLIHIPISYLTEGNGFGESAKVVVYSITPLLLLGWIPIPILDGIGLPIFTLIGIIWSLILCIIGIRELHDITTWWAVAAIILSVFAAFVLVLLFLGKILKFVLKNM